MFKNLSHSLAKDFPPQDLADSLIKIYFEHVNMFLPLFHHPTFEQQWRQGLQHRDTWFGCLCLSLFAVASRWSDDPRVLDDGDLAHKPVEKHKWQRAGWRFFNAAVGTQFSPYHVHEYLRSQTFIVVPLPSFARRVCLKYRLWQSVE